MKKSLGLLSGVFLVAALLGAAEIRVTNPSASSEWCLGSANMITWTPVGDWTNPVAIRLRRAGSPGSEPAVLVISAGTGRNDPFLWTIPNTVPPGSYFIRVRTVGPAGEDGVLSGDSPNFRIKSCVLVAQPRSPEMQIDPRVFQHTFTMAVNFHTKSKHRERGSWNCLRTMGLGLGEMPPTEFAVGFSNRCADRGPLCADECVAEIFRASPIFEAARLRTLIGKTIVQATLKFRYISTESNPHCAIGLDRVAFYTGPVGDWSAHADEVRALAAPTATGVEYRIDITAMTSNWLREEDPAYTGVNHNYHLELIGVNESMEFNDRKCLSRFDSGSLEIKYRD